jgi:hypothetical protein
VRLPDPAEFVVPAPRVRWGAVVAWGVYLAGFMGAAWQAAHNGEVLVYVFCASLIAPALRLSAWVWSGLRSKVSETEAQLMRSRLLARPESLWRARGVRRARG